MHFDKSTYVIGTAAVVVAGVLGFLADGSPGILAAFAGLIPAVLWQVMTDRRTKVKARREQLDGAAQQFVPTKLSGGVTQCLRPEAEIVEFWPRPELAVLRAWTVSPLRTDVRLVIGEGGAGKTRLAFQLGRELREQYGSRFYWVPPGDEARAVAAACQGQTPALLVLDYAETRAGIGGILAQVITSEPPVDVRVLLLARSAGEWWQQLVAGSPAVVSETLAAIVPITLGPLADPSGQQEVYRQAMRAFAAELDARCPDTPLPASLGPNVPALVVHAAALLSVLQHAQGLAGSAPASSAEVIGGLLRHEERYWEQSQARYGLALGPVLTRRAVAAGTLVGADDEESAARLLAALGELADPGLRGRAARWLHDLYPAEQASAAASEWIGLLRPDRLAENLVVGVLRDQPQLALRLLTGLSAERAGRALTLLARAALVEPAARDLLGRVLAAQFPHLAVPALAVAVETNPHVGEQLADLLESGHWPPEVLNQIAQALPGTSVALARAAASTFQQLADTTPPGSEERSKNLVNLSPRLAALGRREEALAAIDEAVIAYRQLAATRPDTFLPNLATALNNQANSLATLARWEEALAAINEAVTIRRKLATARPDTFLPNLATALNNQANRLAALGRREKALAAINEAVTIYRQLATARPDTFLPNLATALNTQANRLTALDRREEALAAVNEAVTIYRQLATVRPDTFLPNLATALNNQSGCLSELGRQNAVAAIEEAITIRRKLAAARPDAFLPDLATTLNNQSAFLSKLGHQEGALAAIDEAVTVYRKLAASHPQVFSERLIPSLRTRAGILHSLGRGLEADQATAEAAEFQKTDHGFRK